MNVPVLGNLFSARDNLDARTELLVLLKPIGIRGQTQAMTNEQRNGLKGLVAIEKRRPQ